MGLDIKVRLCLHLYMKFKSQPPIIASGSTTPQKFTMHCIFVQPITGTESVFRLTAFFNEMVLISLR
jgi:hypothetical protein